MPVRFLRSRTRARQLFKLLKFQITFRHFEEQIWLFPYPWVDKPFDEFGYEVELWVYVDLQLLTTLIGISFSCNLRFDSENLVLWLWRNDIICRKKLFQNTINTKTFSYQCKELSYLARPKSYYIEDYLYKHLDHDESS